MLYLKNEQFTFSFVESEIRNKTFGILTTLNKDGSPHSTGVLYGVSSPDSDFVLYIITSLKYKKTKNIINNPQVSFVIPFPHHILRFVPSSTVTFYGEVKILPFVDHEDLLAIFSEKRILRLITEHLTDEEKEDYVFLKLKPSPKVYCYGLGFNLFKLRGSHTEGGYTVFIPEERL